MLEKDKRWIQFNELHLRRDPEHSPVIEIDEVIQAWMSRITSGNAAKTLDNGQAAIRVTDIKEYPAQQALVLLVRYVNANMAAPSIGDLDSDAVRHEALLDREGVAVSAHVVLSTSPRIRNSSTPQEEVPGIGRSTLQPFLRSEFKAATDNDNWSWPDATENNRRRGYQPVVDLHMLASTTLGEEVKKGSVITYVEFYKHFPKDHGMDEPPSIEESKQILVLKATNQANIFQAIKERMSRYCAEGYNEIKVRYKNQGGRQKTGVMGMSETDIADALLGRSLQICTNEFLAQCHERIVPSLANQMIDALIT